jgi:hypothetical protein
VPRVPQNPSAERRREIRKEPRGRGHEINSFAKHPHRDFSGEFDAHSARANDRDAARRFQLCVSVEERRIESEP